MLRNTSENYLTRAKVYMESNDLSSALNDLTKVIQLNDKSYDAFYNRSMIYYIRQEYDSSLADLQKCVALRPDYKNAKEKLSVLQKDSVNNTNVPIANSDKSRDKDVKGIDRFKDGELHKDFPKR